jgi:2-polyprenyl-3-methyl-5-hydroxy-6-metoxy-1,4-benzoquinol methylase
MSLETAATEHSSQSIRSRWEAESAAGDRWAAVYDDVYDTWQPCYRAYRERIAEVVYSLWYEGRGRVLDAGCGTGAVLELLSTRIPARMLAGVDLAPRMVQHCSDRLKGIELCTTPVEEYVAAEPFDVVVFANSLRHMPDHGLVAKHLAGLLLPGARVVVFEPNPDWLYLNPWLGRRARYLSPSWLQWRLLGGLQMQRTRQAIAAMPSSPQAAVTAQNLAEAFAPHLRLRSQRTSFGVTRLFEEVITDSKPAPNPTRPVCHQKRPWSSTLARLQHADRRFSDRHPGAGGMLELVFEKPLGASC